MSDMFLCLLGDVIRNISDMQCFAVNKHKIIAFMCVRMRSLQCQQTRHVLRCKRLAEVLPHSLKQRNGSSQFKP